MSYWQIEREGKHVTITAFSKMVGYALQVCVVFYSKIWCDYFIYNQLVVSVKIIFCFALAGGFVLSLNLVELDSIFS